MGMSPTPPTGRLSATLQRPLHNNNAAPTTKSTHAEGSGTDVNASESRGVNSRRAVPWLSTHAV